nr:MAG TPA: type I neck protein [Caudoviricetes sp.]
MEVNSLKELEAELYKRVDKALENGVGEYVKDVMQTVIKRDVYDVYTPEMYHRRGEYGGLADQENMNAIAEDGVLTVTNTTMAYPYLDMEQNTLSQNAGQLLAPIIESGNGYDYTKWAYYGYGNPRPFMHNTEIELSNSKWAIEAMLAEGLIRQGIEVE